VNRIAFVQILLAYLLGSIPSAWLAGTWVKGIDIRRHGSGNMGATNVFRVLGPGPGVAVLLADVAKGAAAVLLLPQLAPQGPLVWWQDSGALAASAWWPCLLGLAAVLGHSYTIFLGFKGGKGVATSLGVFLALAPFATLVALAVFGVIFWATRMVSAGSLAAAAILPSAVVLFKEWRPWGFREVFYFGMDQGNWQSRPVLCLAMVLALLVWLKHVPNIRRILAGTESRVGAGGKAGPGRGRAH
jgi:acyl phosphate:glycerol-3-phosphate acyltransferase